MIKNEFKFHLFCFIFASVFFIYFSGALYRGLSNLRFSYFNPDNSDYIDISQEYIFEIPVKTSNLTRIDIALKNLVDEPDIIIKTDLLNENEYSVSYENNGLNGDDSFLLISIKKKLLKNSKLVFKILSNDCLLKVKDSNIINKQHGVPRIYIYLSIIFLWICMFVFFIILYYSKNLKVHNKYLLFSLIFGIISICIIPPFTRSDSLLHFDSIYNMSNIILGYNDSVGTSYMPMRACDMNILPNLYQNGNKTYTNQWWSPNIFNDYVHHLFYNIKNSPDETIKMVPVSGLLKPQRAYIFYALAVSLSRLLHLNQFFLYYLSALFNFLVCVGIVYLGLRRNSNTSGKLIATVATLPFVLMLMYIFSYDSLLLSLAFSIINYSIAIFYEQSIKKADFIILGVMSLILFPIKVIYFPIVFFIAFLYLFSKDIYKKINQKRLILFFILFIIISFFIAYLSVRGAIRDVIMHPIKNIFMIINGILLGETRKCFSSIETFFCNYLDFLLPFLKRTIFIYLIILFFTDEVSDINLVKASMCVSVIIAIFIIAVSLVWTYSLVDSPYGGFSIWGVQSKYCFPFLPLIIISLSSFRNRFLKGLNIKIEYKFDFLQVLSMCYFVNIALYCIMPSIW